MMEDNISDIMLDLLLAADELVLVEIVKYMEEYIITYERDWIQANLVSIFVTVSKYESFTRLEKFCGDLLAQQPSKFFYSPYFTLLDKPTLLGFIERDDLNIEEIEIWRNLIKWTCEQTPIINRDVNKFTHNDFKELEKRLKDFIPYIRFNNITKDQYYLEIQPYRQILPIDSILKNRLPPRISTYQTVLDSAIINNKHAALLSSWIESRDNDETNFNLTNNTYRFNNLLIRGSRDGFSVKKFHELCDNKGPTLVVIKIQGTNQIVGGYNPKAWKSEGAWDKSDDAFIFTLGKGDSFCNIILSRIKYGSTSVYNSNNPDLLGFQDLNWFEGRYRKNYYEKEIMKGPTKVCKFKISDYEVFQVLENT